MPDYASRSQRAQSSQRSHGLQIEDEMPDYASMSNEALRVRNQSLEPIRSNNLLNIILFLKKNSKRELSNYGVKPCSRSDMIEQLSKIWTALHNIQPSQELGK
jgi:hypothetical protein